MPGREMLVPTEIQYSSARVSCQVQATTFLRCFDRDRETPFAYEMIGIAPSGFGTLIGLTRHTASKSHSNWRHFQRTVCQETRSDGPIELLSLNLQDVRG